MDSIESGHDRRLGDRLCHRDLKEVARNRRSITDDAGVKFAGADFGVTRMASVGPD